MLEIYDTNVEELNGDTDFFIPFIGAVINLSQPPLQRSSLPFQKFKLVADLLVIVVNESKQIEPYISSISSTSVLFHLPLQHRSNNIHPADI